MEKESGSISSFLITEDEKDLRIDSFLSSRVEDLTRSRAQALIKEGFVKVNEASPKTSYRLKSGDAVRLHVPPAAPYHLKPEPVEFSLIHEDSSILVLNKPPGVVIHPAPGHHNGTLVHGLLHHCGDLSGIGGVLRPGIVHRLDKDTSGVMVVAKNDRGHTFIAAQFKAGGIRKRYLALVHGIMPGDKGEVDLPISRHPKRRKEMSVLSSAGKRALTRWQRQEEIGSNFSLLSVTPKTGRTHQIRVHLSHQGHPIVGDRVYGFKRGWWIKNCPWAIDVIPQVKRQMLHAETLGFIHPDSGDYCEFSAPIPEDMRHVIESLRAGEAIWSQREALKDKKT